ncbi:MAG: F0F1 ATP synthase subunit epsilon [Epsilonproteobacteria bacterium]|nr:F0F1 ATP synthase subunit epsilon [Campylobacterota bacterium]
MKLMKLEIVTPLGVIFDDEVKQVTLPGSEGEFGVLPDHAALVSLLDTGVIVIETKDGKEISVAVNSGYVKVEENKTLCVVDGAVALNAEDSNLASAIAEAKELLEKASDSNMAIASAMSKVDSLSKGV